MHQIESYDFGTMIVDGKTFENDLILLPDTIKDGWWRDEGHELQPQDLEAVVDADIDTLIVGKGFHGRMRVPEKTRDVLAEHGIAVEVMKTREAWERYNAEADEKTAAAFHLTC